MKRSKTVTSMLEPYIWKLITDNEDSVSTYLHDLACADLIRRKLLTVDELLRMNEGNADDFLANIIRLAREDTDTSETEAAAV